MSSLDEILGSPPVVDGLQGVYSDRAALRIPQLLKDKEKKRPLVIIDSGVEKFAPTVEIIDCLADLDYYVYRLDNFPVSIDEVKEAAAVYLYNECDCLLSIGGGSAMDLGKLTGLVVCNPLPWADYFHNPRAGKTLPVTVMVPSSCRGAESSSRAFVLDRSSMQVRSITRDFLLPAYLCYDSRYLENMPRLKLLTALADLWAHMCELWMQDQARKDFLAVAGREIRNSLKHRKVRASELQELSLEMGKVYRTAGYGFLHGLSHVITAHTGIGHAQAIGFFLPGYLQYELNIREQDRLAACGGWDNGSSMLLDLKVLKEEVGLVSVFTDYLSVLQNNLYCIAGQSALSEPALADSKGITPEIMAAFIRGELKTVMKNEEDS